MIAIGEYTISALNDLDYYEVTSSDSMVVIEDENFTPEAVTFTSKHRLGNGNLEAYSGRFKIETSKDGETWETKYTSSGNESAVEYELPSALEDKVPYLFRKSPDSDRAVEEIVGGTVGWNQLVEPKSATVVGINVTVLNNKYVFSGTATSSGGRTTWLSKKGINIVSGHKYVAYINGNVADLRFYITKLSDSSVFIPYFSSSTVFNATVEGEYNFGVNVSNGTTYNCEFYFMLIDLTTMFGSTIADYIYSLEQSTAGAGVAKLKEWGFFTEDYYEYCEPTLKSVEGLVRKKTVGFNQWDEEWEVGAIDANGVPYASNTSIRSKNFIPVIGGATYYYRNGSNTHMNPWLYDANQNFISRFGSYFANRTFTVPSGCSFIKIALPASYGTTYNHDICINLSDPTKNGTYEPYESHSYPLDSTLTLRGVLKLDSNNNLYFDGDVYPADGQGKRRYGEYTFTGSETWRFASTFFYFLYNFGGLKNSGSYITSNGIVTRLNANPQGLRVYLSDNPQLSSESDMSAFFKSGTKVVYELTTPTTFTAQPYHNPQIVGDTEEFVTTGIVPVGHNTKYPANIKNIRCSLYKPNETPSATTLLDQITVPIVSSLQYQPFVQRTAFEWALSSSSTELDENTTWAEQKPKPTQAQPYLWERSRNDYSNGTHTYSDAHCDITISGVISDVDKINGQITNKIWQSDITTSINSYDGTTVSNIRDRVSTTEQNLTGITTRVGAVESTTGSLGTRMTAAESSISQNADNIELKVSKDGVISSINQSPESITISADKVNIAGSTAFTSLNSQVTAIQNETNQKSELIRGTQTAATYSWTGTSTTISQLTDGMEIRYWLPFSVGGGTVSGSYSYYDGSKTTTGTNTGVGLTLTLKDGTMTEEIPVYYGSMSRLTSHYGYGNIIRMIYRENVRVNNGNSTYYTVAKGFWCDANYDTNSNYVQYSTAVTSGATNGVYQYSLIMRDTANTWVSIATTNGTGTSKSAYTGGLYYDKVLYHSSSNNYASNKTTGAIYDSIGFDLRYSTNCGTTLTTRKPVYLVGTINNTDKRFYLNTTQWWTQTVPTSADGKTYIYIGEAYSSYQVWLATENKAYQYYNGRFITLEEIKDLEAMTWINSTGQNAADIIANWATDATSATTTINGGLIQTHTIESTHLATDAIMSNNFQASQNVNSPYSVAGSFLDLTNGNFYTPNFGLDNVNGNAYFNGEITATSGQIGDDTSNHWQIGTVVDFNGNQSAAIESNGTSYIQSGDWMISNNRIDTRHYDNQRKYTYLYEDGTYWDFGLHTPSLTSSNDYENNFIYIRNHESTIPTLEGAWNYVFRVDRNGMIYINGVSLDDKYASIDGVSGAYLPMSGGNLTGNLSVGGNLTVTGTVSGLKNLSINGKTYNGSSAVTVGTIGAAYGGTGQTSLINSANALINALDTGSSTPVDNDYYISQYVNGGTTTKTYHRRPMSTLWLYIKNKINADTDLYTDKFVPKTGGEFTGTVTVSDALIADEITSGNLIVNGVGRFTNGIYGDLTGDVVGTASKAVGDENGLNIASNYLKTSVASSTYLPLAGGTMTGDLKIKGATAKTNTYNSANPKIIFANSGDGQQIQLMYTDYDTVEPPASLTLTGQQGGEYFIAPNIKAIGSFYGSLSGNATSATTATTASQLSTTGTIQTNLASTSAVTYTSGGNITTGVTGTLPVANGGTGATTAQDALWNLARSADPNDLNTAKRLGIFKISNTTTNTPVEKRWGVALNITDDRAEGNNGTSGSTWQFIMDTSSTDVWLRRITNANAWTSWTKFYSTSNKPTKSDVGLGNVTNNAQVKGLSSGTTSGHLVTWGSDGYTVVDSGIAKGSVTTKITLSGTDYSVSSNTITITKANLQSAVQDTSLVLMTAAERSKLSSIQVSEGGTIDFSGVTASAPITATVNETTKAVNITHNTSGVAQGTYRSVTVNTYGHVMAGTNPTTLSGYGITDAKIASGVITLGSNTITPLTVSSTLDATKLSGTASVNTTGNATTATKFSSNRSIALTGNVTGSASSNGENGWSISTIVGDDSHNHTLETIVPKMTKSYTGVIASANNDANCHMYYFKVVPDSYAGQWSIKYRVYATIDEVSTANGSGFEESVVYISGMRNTYSAYRTWNNISNTNYKPYYYHTFYRAKEAGISYGHLLGVSLRSAYNPTTTTNTRNVTFEILDYENCTPTFFDSPVIYADAPGTGSTNYEGATNFDATTQGLTTSGDRNDVNWQNRENYSSRTTKNALYRYQICVTDSTGQIIPINSVNNSVATNKVLMTDSFDPFGEIFYWNSTTTYNAGANVGNSNWYRQYVADLRYSFNCGGYDTTPTLTARLPLYLVASPQTDGTAKLHSSPLSQTLPASDDGLIYIYLGRVYEDTKPYRVVLSIHHPVYWYKDGAVRQYVQRAETANTANSATNATTATNATNLLAYAGNEVTIGANSATSGSSTNNNVYINYRDVNGGSTSNNATSITDYYFYNRKGSMDEVNVRAGTFVGNLTGTATKATQDGDGNTISSYYVTLSTTQTISGAKIFSSAVTFANNTWNLMGNDAYIGDCNVSGKIGIKGKNAATGVRFVPYSGSTNNDITIDGTGNLTATGNLIQQGTITVGSHAKLAYNESLECLEFSFV